MIQIPPSHKWNKREILEIINDMKMVPTKHEGCNLDDMWCYSHQEIMEPQDEPNGANSYNKCINDVILKLSQIL